LRLTAIKVTVMPASSIRKPAITLAGRVLHGDGRLSLLDDYAADGSVCGENRLRLAVDIRAPSRIPVIRSPATNPGTPSAPPPKRSAGQNARFPRYLAGHRFQDPVARRRQRGFHRAPDARSVPSRRAVVLRDADRNGRPISRACWLSRACWEQRLPPFQFDASPRN
jgi:hypothetical protein